MIRCVPSRILAVLVAWRRTDISKVQMFDSSPLSSKGNFVFIVRSFEMATDLFQKNFLSDADCLMK